MIRRVAALLALAACGGGSRTAGSALPRPVETPATPDDVRAAVLDGYEQLSQGYDSVYLEALVRDDRLVFVGVRPGDLVVQLDGPRALAVHHLFGDEPIEIVSKDAEIHLARDGSCAWVADQVSYRLLHGQRRAFLPLDRTAVYERRDGRWLLAMEHLSYPAPDGMAARSAPSIRSVVTGRDDGQAVRQRVAAVLTGGDDSGISLEPEALFVGPRGERARGPDLAKLGTPHAYVPGVTLEIAGLRVALSRSATVAWVAASLDAAGAPLRATFVLEKRGGLWWIVQTHLSRPVTGEALAEELGLGMPGR